MKTRIQNLFLMLALLVGINPAAAQGTTAFTYQGQLRDGGTNANGVYKMIFKLYDALIIGNQIGSAITNSPTLANGLFSVNLDFGASAFDGNARWLDITIQAGTNAPETLTPRVQVMPSPYALYAAVAGTVIPQWQIFDTNGSFVVPGGVTRIMVELWGGGGGGSDSVYGGGGGGGGYGKQLLNVIPGTTNQVTVGQGGSSSTNGGNSSFGGLVNATGGIAATNDLGPFNMANGGEGGTSDASVFVSGGRGGKGYGNYGDYKYGTGGASFYGGVEALGYDSTSADQIASNGDGKIPGGGGAGGTLSLTYTGFHGGHGRVIVYY
jgi:hypothetical protein